MSDEYSQELNEGLRVNPNLREEYEETFTGEEKVQHALKVTKNNFTINIGVVEFNTILVSEPIKNGRKETYSGLTTSIAEMGILSPIHVMVLEGYSDWLKNHNESEEEYEGYKYSILDGFRRVWAGYKNGITRSYAVIWNFDDKDRGAELATTLSLILNKAQKRSWNEIWYLYQILEEQSAMTPGTLEYLLMLESGDAMKLKDIMTCNYPEVRDELLGGKKDLTQAYNMLQKFRKEEDKLLLEDKQGISDLEQADGIVEKAGDQVLSNEEVNEILEMGDSLDGELSDEDFDELMGNNLPDDRQTVGERHPLDPALRAAVLQRDGYKCVVTGRGEGLPAPIALSILNVHHVIPVHAGGTDTMENLVTVCLDVHTLIHIIERNNGKLGMSKEQFDALPEEEKKFITGTMKIARKAVEANRRLGRTREQIRKDTSDSVRFKMPGTAQKENMEAVKMAKKI